MFYQPQYSLLADVFKYVSEKNFSYPTHMHESFELITVTDGEMKITIDEKAYFLKKGMSALVFPNQLHSLENIKNSTNELWIFSSKWVQAYTKAYANKIPKKAVFSLNPFYYEMLKGLQKHESSWKIKGILYSVCSDFDKNAKYTERLKSDDNLLLKIFSFIEKNYSSKCSLSDLSREMGFNYVYLSRYFKEHTKISFTDYVNRYRIDEACYALSNSSDTIIKISLDCGFTSLRSFHRNFKNTLGISPNEYRRKSYNQ